MLGCSYICRSFMFITSRWWHVTKTQSRFRNIDINFDLLWENEWFKRNHPSLIIYFTLWGRVNLIVPCKVASTLPSTSSPPIFKCTRPSTCQQSRNDSVKGPPLLRVLHNLVLLTLQLCFPPHKHYARHQAQLFLSAAEPFHQGVFRVLLFCLQLNCYVQDPGQHIHSASLPLLQDYLQEPLVGGFYLWLRPPLSQAFPRPVGEGLSTWDRSWILEMRCKAKELTLRQACSPPHRWSSGCWQGLAQCSPLSAGGRGWRWRRPPSPSVCTGGKLYLAI